MKKMYLTLLMLLSISYTWGQTVSFQANTEILSGGSYEDCVVDMNGDFLDDIVQIKNDGIKIYYQQPDGSFTSQKFDIALSNYPSWSVCAGDLNADGFNDLLFGGSSRVSFLMSENGGTSYNEVYFPEFIFSQRSSMADIDNDGDLDAFVCHDIDLSHPYRNDGMGNMTLDFSLIETADLGGNYSVIWVDYDNDWNTDMFITKCRQGTISGDIERDNLLYHNNGDGTYTEVGLDANMKDNAQSWSTAFEDFDNDGDFDAMIVNHDFENRMMMNNGDGTFSDSIQHTGINPLSLGAWEIAAADFNNDGFQDILSQMSKELYLNNGDMTFTGYDLPFRDGGLGDLNNDGFIDVVSNNTIYFNVPNNTNNWIKLNTIGTISNLNGIGTNVAIYGSWGRQMKEVRATQSFSPMSSLATHFGIGSATQIDSIVVKWPSREVNVIVNPAINTTIDILEAQCLLSGSVVQVDGDLSFCEGGSVVLTAPEGYDSYTWNNGSTTPTITVTQPGSYKVSSKDSLGCISPSNRVDVNFIIDHQPTISLIGDQSICNGDVVAIGLDAGDNPVWSNGMIGDTIEITETGTYTATIDAICTAEGLTSNSVEVTVNVTPLPGDATIEFDGTLNETATLSVEGDEINWYSDFELTTLIGTGSPWVTPPVTEDTYYFVTNTAVFDSGFEQGGKIDITGPGGIPSTFAYSLFNVWEPFLLKSVDVFLPAEATEGTRTLQLTTVQDEVLMEIVVDVVYGLNTITLNWDIPEGTDLSIRCPEINMFRNHGPLDYPFALSNVGEITSSIYGDTYYYFFYNWVIENKGITCVSNPLEVQITLVDVKEIPELSKFSIAPNPVKDQINAEFTAVESGRLDFRLFNANGKEVKHLQAVDITTGFNRNSIDVSQLPRGHYTLQLSMNGNHAAVKLLLQ